MIKTMNIADALAHEVELLGAATHDPSRVEIAFWQSNQALVAPRKLAVKAEFEHASHTLASMGWPVVTRATGGDVTPQGPGIVNVSLIFVPDGPPDIPGGYERLCRPMEATLGAHASRGWNPGAFCDGAYNVQWNGLKFAGTAQRLKRCKGVNKSAVLAHALMLMRPPSEAAIDALNTFLSIMKEPRQIERDRHTGLPDGVTQRDFIARLSDAYHAELGQRA